MLKSRVLLLLLVTRNFDKLARYHIANGSLQVQREKKLTLRTRCRTSREHLWERFKIPTATLKASTKIQLKATVVGFATLSQTHSFLQCICESVAKPTTTESRATNLLEKAYTDKAVIKKIWADCLKYGYISQDHDILGLWVDKIVVR